MKRKLLLFTRYRFYYFIQHNDQDHFSFEVDCPSLQLHPKQFHPTQLHNIYDYSIMLVGFK
jgi:hypothetical protein